MGNFPLKTTEGAAHSNGAEWDINVETTRQRNARTDCLLIDYECPDTVEGRRARAYFIRALNRFDGSMTQLTDGHIVITSWDA